MLMKPVAPHLFALVPLHASARRCVKDYAAADLTNLRVLCFCSLLAVSEGYLYQHRATRAQPRRRRACMGSMES